MVYLDSVGYVTRIEDVENLVEPQVYEAIRKLDEQREARYLERMDEINDLKDELWEYENLADERMCQIRNGNTMLEEVIAYVQQAKRIDRKKLLMMLEETQNDLNNY